MIAPTIHGVQRPTADSAMVTYNLIDNFALSSVKQDRGLRHSVMTPILKQWLRRFVALVPLRPAALITGQIGTVACPRYEERVQFFVHNATGIGELNDCDGRCHAVNRTCDKAKRRPANQAERRKPSGK
jgi:hypothetical protein